MPIHRWGYTGPAYATKLGLQVNAVRNMLNHITNGVFPTSTNPIM